MSGKLKPSLAQPRIIDETKAARPLSWWKALLIALVCVIAYGLPTMLLQAFSGGTLDAVALASSSNPVHQLVSAFGWAILIACAIGFARWLEKRGPRTLGFVRAGSVKLYAIGMLVGVGSMLVALALMGACGSVVSIGFNPNVAFPFLGAMLVFYLLQTLGEEVLDRGFLLTSFTARYGVAFGLGLSSVFFSLMHLANPSFNVLALINIVLVGVALGVAFLKTGSIWGVAGFHFAWNFLQGPPLGIEVSGTKLEGTLLSTTLGGNPLIGGAGFGIEGSIMVTLVLAVVLIAVILMPARDCSARAQ